MGTTSDKMSGKVKEMGGKLTDDKKMEMKGKMEQESADLRQKAKDVVDDM